MRTTVGELVSRQAMKFPNVVEVLAGYVLGAGGLVTWNMVAHFSDTVHYHQNELEYF